MEHRTSKFNIKARFLHRNELCVSFACHNPSFNLYFGCTCNSLLNKCSVSVKLDLCKGPQHFKSVSLLLIFYYSDFNYNETYSIYTNTVSKHILNFTVIHMSVVVVGCVLHLGLQCSPPAIKQPSNILLLL